MQVKSLCFDHSGTYLAVAGSDVRYPVVMLLILTQLMVVLPKSSAAIFLTDGVLGQLD